MAIGTARGCLSRHPYFRSVRIKWNHANPYSGWKVHEHGWDGKRCPYFKAVWIRLLLAQISIIVGRVYITLTALIYIVRYIHPTPQLNLLCHCSALLSHSWVVEDDSQVHTLTIPVLGTYIYIHVCKINVLTETTSYTPACEDRVAGKTNNAVGMVCRYTILAYCNA